MEFGKRHDTTDTMDFYPCQLVIDLLQTCYEEVTKLLWTCYGETGVMDFGRNRATVGLQQKTAAEEMSRSITKLPLRQVTVSTAVSITMSVITRL